MPLSAPSIPRACPVLCTGLCVVLALGCYRSHERGGDGGAGAPRDAAARDGAAPFDGGAPFDAEVADGAAPDASAPADAWPGIDAPFDGRVERCRVAPGPAEAFRLEERLHWSMSGPDIYHSPLVAPERVGGPPRLVVHRAGLFVIDPATLTAREVPSPLALGMGTHLAAADLDGDGEVEVIGIGGEGGTVAIRMRDGAVLWESAWPPERELRLPGGAFVESGGPTVADLEGDGRPEVVVGRWVLDGIHGRLRWRGRGDTGRGVNGPAGPISCVGDLDGDGRAEVVAGRTLFEADGRARWTAPGPDGWCALGPVRGEGEADVVIVGEGQLRVFAPNGRRVFARALVGASGLERGGPPALADVDGDGAAEIVVAHATALAVYDPGCAAAGGECEAPGLRWSVEVSDPSAATGVVLFDAEGDGAWELAHADQYFLRVLDARSGEVRSLVRNHSRTRTEAPVAADVDGDGRVDLAICSGGRRDDLTSPRPGVRVFGDWYGRWSDARGWAHGHAFDALFEGSLAPRRPERFRAVRASRNARAADLRVEVLRTECEADRVEVIARVWNAGERAAPAGVVVALYGDGVRLGEARTERILAPGERTVVALRGWRGEGRFRVEVDRPEDEREGGRVAECDEANAVLTRCE